MRRGAVAARISSVMRGRARQTETAERSSDPEAAREAALGMLERVRRTRSELVERLGERGYGAQAIDQALDRLAAVGLVDDVEYARAFLESRASRRTAGWRRLEQELRRRGVHPEDVSAARARLEETRGPVDDTAAAVRVLEQVARRYDRLEHRVRRQRLFALLARRGFDGGVIARALDLREDGGTPDDA
jgi:regulatory protein